jgi:hypothetical protein
MVSVAFDRRHFLTLVAVAMTACGCRPPAVVGPPPLTASFRKASVPTKGYVVGLSNVDSPQAIHVVQIYVQSANEKDERPYRVDKSVSMKDSISLGWMELDGWPLKSGDRLRVECSGYDQELIVNVP